MSENKQVLQLGDSVESSDGKTGTVIHSGPYGDSPFQVKESIFTVWPYVESDGTSQYTKRVWKKVDEK